MENLPIYLSSPTDLVALPDIYIKVKTLLESPTSDAAALAHTIAHDPALSVRFLSIANSALFRPFGEITTIQRAIAVLGTRVIHDVVLSTSVGTLFDDISTDVVDLKSVWHASIERAVLAQAIADRLPVSNRCSVFADALLADIGHIILYRYEPRRMVEAIEQANASGRHLHEVELETLGYDYCDIGGYLATQWELPARIATVLDHHQEPAGADNFALETAIVHIAYRLVENTRTATGAAERAALETVGLTLEDVLDIHETSRDLIKETIATFSGFAQAA